jgi:hypothetical protein
MLINVILFLLGSLYFLIVISLGKADTDHTRRRWANWAGLYFRVLRFIFRNRIHFTGEPFKSDKGITVLNANHTHNLDNLILFAFYSGRPEEITSLSTLENTSALDKKILQLNSAITLEKNNIQGFLAECQKKFKQYARRSYPTTLLTYFEGVALNHLPDTSSFYEFIGKPQYLAFQVLSDAFPGKAFYDFTMCYRVAGQPLKPKDPYFLWKLITTATVHIHSRLCHFPAKDADPIIYLDNLYREKNDHLKALIKHG